MPRVSVLLPVYNAERYLREAVDSIFAQTFTDFELLAFDDGSSDKSLKILRSYKDTRLVVRAASNRGLVPVLNDLIGLAQGEYLARMDADDIAHPERLAKQIEFMDANRGCVVLGSQVYMITSSGLHIGPLTMPMRHEEIDACHLKGHCSIAHPTVVMRAAAPRSVGGYNENFRHGEDFDLWLRLAELGTLANLNDALLHYRLHDASTSERKHSTQLETMRRACEAAWQRRGVKGHFEAGEPWRPLHNRVSRHAFALRYGWMAWANGHKKAWWHFFLKALRQRPLALGTWRLLVFGVIRTPV